LNEFRRAARAKKIDIQHSTSMDIPDGSDVAVSMGQGVCNALRTTVLQYCWLRYSSSDLDAVDAALHLKVG
jgi:hypothetical protein